MPEFRTVAEVSELLKVDSESVLGHIRAGRLQAVNIGMGPLRPRYRISTEALQQFFASRTAATPTKTRTRRRKSAGVTEYFS